MKNGLLFTFWILVGVNVRSQTINPHYQFIQHLIFSHDHKNALQITHFDKMKFGADTSHFLLGYNHHFLKQPDSTLYYLNKITPASAMFKRGRAYYGLNALFKKDYAKADTAMVEAIRLTAGTDRQLFLLQHAASVLLQRNYPIFDSVSREFDYNNYLYSAEQKYLVEIRQSVALQRKKSPVVAGLLSAVVPGAGKFYAGKKGAAMATFMTNAVLAGFVLESYYRDGYKSPQFIGFGTIFMCFYAGNIMGSVYSVKQQIRSQNGKINNEILATIHIPVDRVFGH